MTNTAATAIAVLAALAAAASFGVAAALQHRQARLTPDAGGVRLLARLAAQPLWLAGIALAALAYGMQALALAFGPLALVAPIVATDLLFALPVAARWSRPLRARDWLGCVLAGGGRVGHRAGPRGPDGHRRRCRVRPHRGGHAEPHQAAARGRSRHHAGSLAALGPARARHHRAAAVRERLPGRGAGRQPAGDGHSRARFRCPARDAAVRRAACHFTGGVHGPAGRRSGCHRRDHAARPVRGSPGAAYGGETSRRRDGPGGPLRRSGSSAVIGPAGRATQAGAAP